MQPQTRTTPYEVYCPHCRVTFPVGNRRCLHCGERLARDLSEVVAPGIEVPAALDAGEEELAVRRKGMSPVTALWLLLAVAVTVYRSCTGG